MRVGDARRHDNPAFNLDRDGANKLRACVRASEQLGPVATPFNAPGKQGSR